MKKIKYFQGTFLSIFLVAILFLSPNLLISEAKATENNSLSPLVSDAGKSFSEDFCGSIANGLPPEEAGELTAKKAVKGLMFSPIFSEIMATPKEYLALSISKDIYEGCGESLEVSREELDNYLITLANKIPNKSNNNNFPVVKQKPSSKMQ